MSDITITQQSTNLELQITPFEVVINEASPITLELSCSSVSIDIQVIETIIDIETNSFQTIEIIREGPRGPQGDSGTVIEAIAGEAISALRIVRAINATEVIKADSTSTFEDAKTMGIALNAANIGDTVRVQFFGTVSDPFFNFPNNDPLFLTLDGQISNVQDPLSLYNTTIGYSLGNGAIFINLQEPIEL